MKAAPFAAAWKYGRRRLTRLEAGMFAAVVAVALAVFADTTLDYMELAERTAVHVTLNLTASAINIRAATAALRGASPPTGAWAGRNPFDITREPPKGYVGELGGADLLSLERPAWVFDRQRAEIVYLPRLRRGLRTRDPLGVLRFRLATQPSGFGYMLVPTHSYDWGPLR